MKPRAKPKLFKKNGRPPTLKDLLLRDWRAKFISFVIGIAIWAVIKPLVEKKRYPGTSPGGGSASVPAQISAPSLARHP